MLIRSRFILALFLVGAWGLAWTPAATVAAPTPHSPTTKPAPAAVDSMESAAIDSVPLAPAVKGKLENEPIRRKVGGLGKASLPTTNASNAAAKAPAPSVTTGLDFTRVVLSLGVVLGLVFLMRWCGKRFLMGPTAGRSSRAIQVISRTIISPKQHLLLLQVGRRVLVVADSGGQMSSLSEITDPDEIASLVGRIAEEKSVATGVPTFGGMMGRFRGGYDRSAADARDAEAVAAQSAAETPVQTSVAEPEDPALATTQDELQGLMRKVRLLSGNFKTSA